MDNLLVRTTKLFKHPRVVVAIALVLTLGFAAGIPFLKFDNNIRNMIPAHNRDLKMDDYYEDESRFGSSSYIFLGVESPDTFSQKSLSYFHLLQGKIEALNNTVPPQNVANLLGLTVEEGTRLVAGLKTLGINESNYGDVMVPVVTSAQALQDKLGLDPALASKVSAGAKRVDPRTLYNRFEDPIHKVESLISADYITNQDDSLVVQKLVDEKAITKNADGSVSIAPEAVEGLKAKLKSWEIYQGVLVSADGKMGSLVVKLNTHDVDVKSSLNQAVEKVIAGMQTDGFKTYLDGEPVIEDKIARYMVSDIAILLPLVVIVVLLILWACFRNLQGILYPSYVMLVTVVWAVGLMAWLGIPVTMVGSVMPVLLVAISSAYGIHQMNHYLLDPSHDKMAVLVHNMKTVGLAILLSGITVVVGFGALAVEDFVPIKNFGILTAFGDLVGVAAALFLLPALILWGKKPKNTEYKDSEKSLVSSMLKVFVRLNQRHSVAVIVVSLALMVVFAGGIFWVKADLNNILLFKPDDPIRVADDTLNEKLAGTQTVNLVLDTDLSDVLTRTDKPVASAAPAATTDSSSDFGPATDTTASGPAVPVVTTPEILNKVEAFNNDVVKKFPYVTKVLSFNTMLKKMNQEMKGGDPVNYVIPQDPQLISQYLLTFSGDLQGVLSPNHDKMRISITMKRTSTEESEAVARYALGYFGADFLRSNHLQANITGTAHLYYVANTLLVDGTIKSVIVCIVVVFLLLLYVLRNFWISLIAMLPIFITVVINYGMLGLFNIPLNAGTALVSSLAIGIGVDYSIHYITWYRREIREKRDVNLALENTIIHKGRAILYNMLVIFGGFLVLVVSKFVPLVQFGGLVAVCMVTTAIGALVFVPAVMRLLAKKEHKFLYMEKTLP